jgi:hypothetical protein
MNISALPRFSCASLPTLSLLLILLFSAPTLAAPEPSTAAGVSPTGAADWQNSFSAGTVYTASTTGFVVAQVHAAAAIPNAAFCDIRGYTDNGEASTQRAAASAEFVNVLSTPNLPDLHVDNSSFTMPVHQGDKWKYIVTLDKGCSYSVAFFPLP